MRKLISFNIFLFILCFSFITPLSSFAKGNGELSVLTVSELKAQIKENKGKVLIVDFWATWCPPCKDEIPGFISLYKKYKDKGLEILGIAVDEEGSRTVKPFAKRMGINYPLFLGGYDLHQEYNISGLPTTLIFDKQGELKVRHVGFASKKEFESEIINYLK